MRRGIAFVLALILLGTLAPQAQATFHLIKVREVAPNPAGANSAFIELQMYAPGQNLVAGHEVDYYTEAGALLGTTTLGSKVANGDNQRTILIGDTATAGTPDFVNPALADALMGYGPGGAVCWEAIDCVSWGAFTGAALLPSPPGTPAAAIPAGSALERSIAPGCATLLEASDDTDDSLADFALAPPTPRNNATAPTETACTGGGGGGSDTDAPQTKLTKKPKKRSRRTTAKFKFKADEQGATFECKLDKGKLKRCKSPKKYKHLKPGKHTFKVIATDAAGNADPSPAKAKFKVLPKH